MPSRTASRKPSRKPEAGQARQAKPDKPDGGRQGKASPTSLPSQAGRQAMLETRKPDKPSRSPSKPDQAFAVSEYGKPWKSAEKPRQGAGKGKSGQACQEAGALCRTSRKGTARSIAQHARQAWQALPFVQVFARFFRPFPPVFSPRHALLWAQSQPHYRHAVIIAGAWSIPYGRAVNCGRGRLPLWARP